MALDRTAGTIRVQGLDDVLEKLNAFIDDVPLKTKKGLIEATLFIRREAQKRTPIDLGNLRASADTVWKGKSGSSKPVFKDKGAKKEAMKMSGDHAQVTAEMKGLVQMSDDFWSPFVIDFFSAYYALYVHEDLTKRHPVGEAMFLRRAMVQNYDAILAIVKREAIKAIKEAGRRKSKRCKSHHRGKT